MTCQDQVLAHKNGLTSRLDIEYWPLAYTNCWLVDNSFNELG